MSSVVSTSARNLGKLLYEQCFGNEAVIQIALILTHLAMNDEGRGQVERRFSYTLFNTVFAMLRAPRYSGEISQGAFLFSQCCSSSIFAKLGVTMLNEIVYVRLQDGRAVKTAKVSSVVSTRARNLSKGIVLLSEAHSDNEDKKKKKKTLKDAHANISTKVA